MRRRHPAAAYQLALQNNEDQRCKADNCLLHRNGLDAFCRRHTDRARRYGSPKAGPLKRASWAPYRVAYRHLFDLNTGHAGLVEALRYLEGLLARGAARLDAYRGAAEVRRLVAHGITARQVLEEVCAVWHYLDVNPTVLPDDRSRDFALARGVLALAPRPIKVSYASGQKKSYRGKAQRSALLYLGRHLREVLAEFLVTAKLGLEAQAKAKAMTEHERRAARTAPMAVSHR